MNVNPTTLLAGLLGLILQNSGPFAATPVPPSALPHVQIVDVYAGVDVVIASQFGTGTWAPFFGNIDVQDVGPTGQLEISPMPANRAAVLYDINMHPAAVAFNFGSYGMYVASGPSAKFGLMPTNHAGSIQVLNDDGTISKVKQPAIGLFNQTMIMWPDDPPIPVVHILASMLMGSHTTYCGGIVITSGICADEQSPYSTPQ
jgi:hypothetical protein